MVDDPLVRDLQRPENLPPPVMPVEVAVTHASFVFLTGDSAYKVKRAKDYGFFDYRSLAARKHFTEEEVRLNRRTAPDVYRGVLPVTRDAAGLSLVRPGKVVDYAVHMRRLPAERSALALTRAGRLSQGDLDAVARTVAGFYARAEVRPEPPGALRANFEENWRQTEPFVGKFIAPDLYHAARQAQESWLEIHRSALERRVARDGHGDLRLEHVYLLPEGVLIIDCIEFLDRFRIADPALDVAFLAMDLEDQGRRDLSEHFLARFAYESDDYDLYPLADGYVSYRAWVRGKVSGFLAADPKLDSTTAARKACDAGRYFVLAHDALARRRGPPRLVGVAGLIGSGKTTVAEGLGHRIAAPVVSADATRKFLGGIPHEATGDRTIYGGTANQRVQTEVLRRSGEVLLSGRTAILDTTFSSRDFRKRARELARAHQAPFLLVECRAPEPVARERLRGRAGGVSDAREWLYSSFARNFHPVTELPPGEHLVADTTRPLEELLLEIEARLH